MRKMGVVLCSLLLAATTVLSACSKQGEDVSKETQTPKATGQAQTSAPDETVGYTLPIVEDGSVTLRYAGWDNWYAPKSLSQNLPVWQEVEKRTGVKIKWEVAPVSQYATSMQPKLAAAKDLPDIIALPVELDKVIEGGLVEPLDELIDKYAPNIKKFMEDNPVEYKKMRAFDGKLYSLAAVTTGGALTDPMGFLLRKDWLDKLNLPEPKTLDDWYTVLKAFKEKDPNGNNKADEIPYMPQYGYKGLGLFGNAVGLHLFYSNGYYPDKDGKVRFEWMTPEAKELIVWLNKLYTEGLIDPSFLQTTEEHIIAAVSREQVGSTMHFLSRMGQFDSMSADKENKSDWMLALPPAQPGYEPYYEKYGPISGNWVITKESKNKEAAIKWLDYIYASEEGNRLMTFGIEGMSYKMVNGEPEYTDFVLNNPEGLDPANTLRSIGAYPPTPWVRAGSGPLSKSPAALLKNNPKALEQAKRVENMMVDNEPFASMTAGEIEELSVISADMQTYIDETIVNFITGKTPIDWDKYVSKLQEYGMDKVLKVKQQQYERFIKD
ncbi:extracellular solute-binding protein [Paenibacillus eucommiae]|uniref:Aldouronate transport system substrate-binding protein n=1 Tax=Paenibacillus eucommiae TaxID=1355755 RepID=A0ABS4IVR4_9BACL|nr:extracellular solute-binding protein [Paenibacillus eucommiae]MBP1991674.1 putative aldouronate transport system substrate-binding protein [Paenibacillus eucommiae]